MYSNIIKKANQSSDTQLIRNLNTALATSLAEKGATKYSTAHDAFAAVDEAGYNIGRIVSKSGYNIAYEMDNGRFVLLDTAGNGGNGKVLYPVDVKTNKEYAATEAGKANYFVVASTNDDAYTSENGYSVYAGPNFKATTVTLKGVGFDAGDKTGITAVNYNGTDGTNNVVVRTNSFETLLVVSAPSDTVNHHGFAYITDVQSINTASYHEYGTVGRLKVAQGHAVVENGGTVFCAMETTGAANIDNNNGKIYTETTNDADNGNENVTQKANGVFEAQYLDCGYGHHNMQKLVVDASHTYEVCTACGYTVKAAGVEAGAVVYHTSDDKTAVASDPEVTVDPTNGEVTVDTTNATTPIVTGDVNNDVDVEKVNNCEHAFAYADEEGLCVGTCSKCGLKTSQEHSYWDLDGENVGEGAKCIQCNCDPISGVCKIGHTGYDSLADAVAAVPTDNTETTITMIANYGFTENEGVVVAKGQNIVFDLNGYTFASEAPIPGGAALITVNGKMTVKDSSDKNFNGTGKGKITTHIQKPDEALIPGYASNTFKVSAGELVLESGIIENYSAVVDAQGKMSYGASYCVDLNTSGVSADSVFTMKGGRLIGQYADQAVRLCAQSTTYWAKFNMTDGVIESGGFWMQYPGATAGVASEQNCLASVDITGGEINGMIDLVSYNASKFYANISGNAVVHASKIRVRSEGNTSTGKNNVQKTDCYVHVNCAEFTCEQGFDSSSTNISDVEILKKLIEISSTTSISNSTYNLSGFVK